MVVCVLELDEEVDEVVFVVVVVLGVVVCEVVGVGVVTAASSVLGGKVLKAGASFKLFCIQTKEPVPSIKAKPSNMDALRVNMERL